MLIQEVEMVEEAKSSNITGSSASSASTNLPAWADDSVFESERRWPNAVERFLACLDQGKRDDISATKRRLIKNGVAVGSLANPKNDVHGPWFTFKSDVSDDHLFARVYCPVDYLKSKKKPKAIVAFAVGSCAHCDAELKGPKGERLSYRPWCEAFFEKNDILVASFDPRGHGHSSGRYHYIPSIEACCGDLNQFAYILASHFEDVPLFLMGDSWSGSVVLWLGYLWQTLWRPPTSFHAVISCTPPIQPDLPPPHVVQGLKALEKFFPYWIPPFMPHPVNLSRLCKEPSVCADVTKDVYGARNTPYRLATAKNMLDATMTLQKTLSAFQFPFLAVMGAEDRVCNPAGAEKLMKESKTAESDKEYVKIPEALHAFTLDPTASATSVEAISSYIEKRVEKGPFLSHATGKQIVNLESKSYLLMSFIVFLHVVIPTVGIYYLMQHVDAGIAEKYTALTTLEGHNGMTLGEMSWLAFKVWGTVTFTALAIANSVGPRRG